MLNPNYVLLHVDSPERSAAFYSSILQVAPVEQSPTFVLFVFKTGLKLGLWSRHTVEPESETKPGAAEVGFSVASSAEADELCKQWEALNVTILQQPEDMDFGRAFTAQDPDGHRLRVFALNA